MVSESLIVREFMMKSAMRTKTEQSSDINRIIVGNQSDFEIGDIVESLNTIVAPLKSKGVVISKYTDDSPPDYDIYWFSSKLGSVFKEDLKICSGSKLKGYCMGCKYKYLCPNIYEIVNCDNSEFGEWRGEGELDHLICRKRMCKHFNVCAMKKWLPNQN